MEVGAVSGDDAPYSVEKLASRFAKSELLSSHFLKSPIWYVFLFVIGGKTCNLNFSNGIN